MGYLYSSGPLAFGNNLVERDIIQVEAVDRPFSLIQFRCAESVDGSRVGFHQSVLITINRVTDSIAVPLPIAWSPLIGGVNTHTFDWRVHTTSLTTGKTTFHSQGWNQRRRFSYQPPPEMRPVIDIGATLTIAVESTPPAQYNTLIGWCIVEEL